jgi:hypothetical protein
MVENLAESPGMCSDGPGSAPREIPKRGAITLRGSKRKEKGANCFGGGRKEEVESISSRGLGPTRARQGRTVRDTPADGPRGARTVRAPGADSPLLLPERPEPHLRPTSHADGPRCPGGQSARSSRMVRPVAADSSNSSFKYNVK